MRQNLKRYYYYLIIILAGLLTYTNSLLNGFVWDDEHQIVRNTVVHSITNFTQFFQGSTFNSGGATQQSGMYYRPLLSTFYSLIYTIFGPNPYFFHAFQLGIHIVNSILVFLIFGSFFAPLLALGGALLFLVHPINTESVVYIADLQEPLFLFFGILALWLRIKGAQAIIVFPLLLLSLLSKETGALFLVILFLYEFLFRRLTKKFLALGGITLCAYLYLRLVLGNFPGTPRGPIYELALLDRLLNSPRAFLYYIGTFFFPKNLAISQHWVVTDPTIHNFFLPMLFLGFLFFGLFLFAQILKMKNRALFKKYMFFLLWFVLGLSIHSQVVALDMTVADRWFYLPIVGMLGMILCTLHYYNFDKKSHLKVLAVPFVLIFIVFSLRSVARNANWKSDEVLFSHDIEINKDSYQLEANYATILTASGQYDDAATHYRRSIELYPNNPVPYVNLGSLYAAKKDYKTAYDLYRKALQVGDDYYIYEKIAVATLSAKGPREARKFTNDALKKFPENHILWIINAVSNYRLDNKREAFKALSTYRSLSPDPKYGELYNAILQNNFGTDF